MGSSETILWTHTPYSWHHNHMFERNGLPLQTIALVIEEEIIETHQMNPRYVTLYMNTTAKQWRRQLTKAEWEKVWGMVCRQLSKRHMDIPSVLID